MRTLRHVVMLAGTLIVAGLADLTAQSNRPPELSGTVTAARDGSPLAGAVVRELTTGREARTDGHGRFRLSSLSAGPQSVEIRYPGFEPVVFDVTLRGHETFTIPTGVLSLLEEVNGFHRREAQGRGEFVNREQLDRWNGRHVSDVLRQVSGVRVELRAGNTPAAGRFRIRMNRTSETCHPIAFLDGAFLGNTALFDVDAVVSVESLRGIEVYRGLGEVPAEFDVPGAQCGVLVMWTEY